MGGTWLAIQRGAFAKEYWIHTTSTVGWLRTKTTSGKWECRGVKTLYGATGKSRVARVRIEGKRYARHRLIALAKDGTAEGLAKFLDWKNNPVEHKKRRREDERPDDTPENVDFGTHATNNADPNRKKRKPSAIGHPVILMNSATGETESFASERAAAAFLGARAENLHQYLNKTNGVKNMPPYSREGTWDAAHDDFELPDAVRLVRAAAELHLSPSRPNRLFRKLMTGKFCETKLERGDNGYVGVPVLGGGEEMLHRLIVDTLDPGAFDAKLATNPGLTKADLDVDHVDGDQCNNAIANLKVLTKREHSRKHALAIEWIDTSGKVLETFECAADVVEMVVGKNGKPLHESNVRKVCDGDEGRKQTGGQRFRWKDEALVQAKRAAKKEKESNV